MFGYNFALLVFSTLHWTWLSWVGMYLCITSLYYAMLNSTKHGCTPLDFTLLYYVWMYLCSAKLISTPQNWTILHSAELC